MWLISTQAAASIATKGNGGEGEGMDRRELAANSAAAKRSGQKPVGRWAGKEWTPAQLGLLGTDDDKVIARKIGRSRSAVTTQRVKRKIPAFSGRPGGGRAWTAEEAALLGTGTAVEVAKKLGRTPRAVADKRHRSRTRGSMTPSP